MECAHSGVKAEYPSITIHRIRSRLDARSKILRQKEHTFLSTQTNTFRGE
jgi:hypothetical protein